MKESDLAPSSLEDVTAPPFLYFPSQPLKARSTAFPRRALLFFFFLSEGRRQTPSRSLHDPFFQEVAPWLDTFLPRRKVVPLPCLPLVV